MKSIRAAGVFALGLFCSSIVFGQAQEAPRFSRNVCVKVKDGKMGEFGTFLQDVTVKLAKVSVESGVSDFFVIARAVAPAGTSARCDYHLVTGYTGFPPEALTPEQLAAGLKKAGIAMSREAVIAKRDELSYLVGVDVWRLREAVGTADKDSYARLNYFKVKPGMMGEWIRLESTGWKLLAEAAAKEHPGAAWRASTLAMPGGTSLPYNAMTVDMFPSWAALGQGIPVQALWNKAHPNKDFNAYFDELNGIVERPWIDIVRLVEVIRK